MNRPFVLWAAFALCLLVVLAAMGWTSSAVIRLDRSESLARAQAELEESIRLALWRMDSALTLLVAQESSRPYHAYGAPSGTRGGGKQGGGKPGDPNAFGEPCPQAAIHFQLDQRGTLTSPELPPSGGGRPAAGGAEEDTANPASRLEDLRSLAPPALLAQAFSAAREPAAAAGPPPAGGRQGVQAREGVAGGQQQDLPQTASRSQTLRNDVEWQARAGQMAQAYAPPQNVRPPAGRLEVGRMQPVWIGGALILARRVSLDRETLIQGLWFDWPRLREWLLSLVADLLPSADLQASAGEGDEKGARRLAALPLVLLPGAAPGPAGPLGSPLLLSLLVAWASLLLAAGAVAALLRGVMSLSERRAAFVSAVTHELRTPLTTFRMYTEMLREGMVSGAEQEKAYLTTLCQESTRLTHLVENVLAYARLERNRAGERIETHRLGALLPRFTSRLAERASQAGLELVVEAPPEALDVAVSAGASAVEQILFNLVDNACKYAARASDPRLHLEARAAGRGAVELHFRDHGPGIPPADARRLFRPFSRSAREAAGSAPGVGLGLALSRRLARSMGGDLTYRPAGGGGACFVLTLKRSGPPEREIGTPAVRDGEPGR